MDLIIAEKPKVAQKIAEAICTKLTRKAQGGVSYYVGEANGKEIVVVSAVGHIYTLTEKKKTNSYPAFDIQWVPSFEVDKGAAFTKPYLTLIKSLAKKADNLIIACDFDIEGSLIGGNVYRFAYGKKKGQRMKFSALTKSDLSKAYEKAGEIDFNNINAGEARHILDWYYGINLSRALMNSIRAVSKFRVMSIGRVQGPALHMLAMLEKKIKAFVSSPYWEVTAVAKGVTFLHSQKRFLEEEKAKQALDNTGKTAIVSSLEKKDLVISPDPNFDLTSLQVEAYSKLGIQPSRTLQLSQGLYEESLISYPRTSSQQIPSSIDVRSIIHKLKENKDYEALASKLIEKNYFTPLQGKKEDPAHPAIHPTGQKGQFDSEYHRKLYDLIVKRFLASFADPAKKQKTDIEIDSNGEKYNASGTVTKEKNWIEFYMPYYKSKDVELPEMKQGETVPVEKKKKEKKMTKPPNRYTAASIISELEKKHLGTKATRSTIIDTLFKRGYINGKSIEVTDFGMKVCNVLEKHAPEILDEDLTEHIEENMEKIQDGKITSDSVVQEGKDVLSKILAKWKTKEKAIGADLIDALQITIEKESTPGVCNKCGKNLRIIHMKMGKQFVGCNGYPDCRNAYPLPGSALIKTTEELCEKCKTPIVEVIRKGSRPFKMCLDTKCETKANWGKKPQETKGQSI
ncbi:MAG: DNA topoisomerase I [Candidatus Micrarchaeota archaeon]